MPEICFDILGLLSLMHMFVYHFDTTVNEIILFTLFAAGFWISHHGSIFVDYMFNLSLQNDYGYVD